MVTSTGDGVLTLETASVRQEDGSIAVHLESSAYWGSFPETHNLPVSSFHVEEDEVVGVCRHDEGRKLEYGPAILLLRYSNETKRRVMLKMAEMAALGLAAGAVGVPVRVTLLVWCDRAAMAVRDGDGRFVASPRHADVLLVMPMSTP